MAKKGITVSVYRSGTDCTNGGVSAAYDEFVLIGEGLPEVFLPSENCPALELHWRGGHLYAAPVAPPSGAKTIGPMMGGNFVYSCDSRFRRVSLSPIAVHDRYETSEQYDSNFD